METQMPLPMIVYCEACCLVTEGYKPKCPNCGHVNQRCCHTKHCYNLVIGDTGTKCEVCK